MCSRLSCLSEGKREPFIARESLPWISATLSHWLSTACRKQSLVVNMVMSMNLLLTWWWAENLVLSLNCALCGSKSECCHGHHCSPILACTTQIYFSTQVQGAISTLGGKELDLEERGSWEILQPHHQSWFGGSNLYWSLTSSTIYC